MFSNVVSTLILGWYDVATSGNVKSILKQIRLRECGSLQRWSFSISSLLTLEIVKTTFQIRP